MLVITVTDNDLCLLGILLLVLIMTDNDLSLLG